MAGRVQSPNRELYKRFKRAVAIVTANGGPAVGDFSRDQLAAYVVEQGLPDPAGIEAIFEANAARPLPEEDA